MFHIHCVLSITCGTLLFSEVSYFLLFGIFVAFFSLAIHTEVLPYKHRELNSLMKIAHWQNVLVLITMLFKVLP